MSLYRFLTPILLVAATLNGALPELFADTYVYVDESRKQNTIEAQLVGIFEFVEIAIGLIGAPGFRTIGPDGFEVTLSLRRKGVAGASGRHGSRASAA